MGVKQALFARNLICICIDEVTDGDYSGQLWHQYSDDPIEFHGVTEMLLRMDSLYDQWDFPQRGLEKKSFIHGNYAEISQEKSEDLVIDRIQKLHGFRNVQNHRGKVGTMMVQVIFRQKATWQGKCLDTDRDEIISFDSEMELLDLMRKNYK